MAYLQDGIAVPAIPVGQDRWRTKCDTLNLMMRYLLLQQSKTADEGSQGTPKGVSPKTEYLASSLGFLNVWRQLLIQLLCHVCHTFTGECSLILD